MTRDDVGGVPIMVAVLATSLLVFGGVLIVDNGFVGAAEARVGRVADAAALEAAYALDLHAYRSTAAVGPELRAARDLAAPVVRRSGYVLESVDLDGSVVVVVVRGTQPTPWMSVFGVGELSVRAVGRARLELA